MRSVRRHRGARRRDIGKKVVYITQYKNLANEVMKDYARKGYLTEVKAETDKTGQAMFVVYVYLGD